MVVLQSMWKGPYHCWNFMESRSESATYVYQMFSKYAKTKSEIMEHYKKEHILFHPKSLIIRFQTIVRKSEPKIFLDNPNPLIRNVKGVIKCY